MKTKQVFVIRKDLGLKKTDMIDFGIKAANELWFSFFNPESGNLEIDLNDELKDWLVGTYTKVVVSTKSEEELVDINNKAKDSNILTSLVKNSEGIPVAICVGPSLEDKINELTGHLSLL